MARRYFLVGLLTLVAFPTTVESPPLNCSSQEYASGKGFCCKKCPAGTYKTGDCRNRHQDSLCKSCIEGKDYTAHENDFDNCLLCSECKPGFEMVSPCTRTSNTVCQCPDGLFLPSGYELCINCKTTCPAGQTIIQNCSATKDALCGPLPTAKPCPPPQKITNGKWTSANGSDMFTSGMFVEYSCDSGYKLTGNNRMVCTESGYWKPSEPTCTEATDTTTEIVLGVGASISIVVGAGIICYFYRQRTGMKWPCGGKKQFCKSDEGIDARDYLITDTSRNQTGQLRATSQSGLPQNAEASNLGASNTSMESSAASDVQLLQDKKPPQIRIKNKTKDLDDIYFEVRKLVVWHNWNMLMRKSGLSENEIERINHDYPNDSEEQRYRMLTTLRDRFGVEKALVNLLAGLRKENLNGICENLINELVSKDIITRENNESNTEA